MPRRLSVRRPPVPGGPVRGRYPPGEGRGRRQGGAAGQPRGFRDRGVRVGRRRLLLGPPGGAVRAYAPRRC
eukprot:13285609-Alexandrium_andersonii.AAC.1